MLSTGCQQPLEFPIPTPPALGLIDAQAWGADISAGDYDLEYWVHADLRAEYNTGEVFLEASVIEGMENSIEYEYSSIGALTDLTMAHAPGFDVDGWPGYLLQSTAYIEEYDITVTVDGVMVFEEYIPETARARYNFEGWVTLDLFGDEVTIEDDVYYEDYDYFWGEVKIWSRNVVITPPETTEPASPP